MSQLYSFLNDVKTDLTQYEREGLTSLEIEKFKKTVINKPKNKRGRRTMTTAACAAIAVLLIGNTAFADEIHTAAKSIEWQIGNLLGIEKDLQDYVTVLNTSRTDKGYTITLNEVILNEKELIVSSMIKSEKPINDDYFMTSAEIYVNGKNVSLSAGGASKMLDDYTEEEIMTYSLDGVDTDQTLDFEIEYNQIGIDENEVKGNWDFKFAANGKALAIDTKHIPLDVRYELPDGAIIKLTEYTSNDLGEKIYFEVPVESEEDGGNYDMELEGKDDLGNPVDFYMSNFNGEKGTGCFEVSEPVNENASSITLKPYAVKFPETSGRLSNDYNAVGDEFTIELSNITQ